MKSPDDVAVEALRDYWQLCLSKQCAWTALGLDARESIRHGRFGISFYCRNGPGNTTLPGYCFARAADWDEAIPMAKALIIEINQLRALAARKPPGREVQNDPLARKDKTQRLPDTGRTPSRSRVAVAQRATGEARRAAAGSVR